MNYENRFTPAALDVSAEGKLIVGYAAVFAPSRSEDLGGFVEVIDRHAFDRTLKEFPAVAALVEHNPQQRLATTTNGTLRLVPDEHGLRIEIDPADTSYARDILALVKRGDIGGMSFRFRPFPGGESIDVSGAIPVRTLRSVELKEISIVGNPAYPATEVFVRALEAARLNHNRQALRRMRLRIAAA